MSFFVFQIQNIFFTCRRLQYCRTKTSANILIKFSEVLQQILFQKHCLKYSLYHKLKWQYYILYRIYSKSIYFIVQIYTQQHICNQYQIWKTWFTWWNNITCKCKMEDFLYILIKPVTTNMIFFYPNRFFLSRPERLWMKAKYFYNRIFKTRNCQVNFFRKDILEDFKLVRLKKQKKFKSKDKNCICIC